MRWGRRPVMSRPWYRSRPAVGALRPVMRLNSVVLPAPLGPIRPKSSPRGTENDTRLTAMTPPKLHVRASTDSISAAGAEPLPDSAAGGLTPCLRDGGQDPGARATPA